MTSATVAPTQLFSRDDSPRVLRHGAITLHSADDIEAIAAAGSVVAHALRAAADAARAGRATRDIDAVVRDVVERSGAVAAFLNYPNPTGGAQFPAACCTSVNSEVVHGIPGPRMLADNDLLSIDVGVRLNGWHADAAISLAVGNASAERRALVACANEVLRCGIALMEPGRRWSDIALHMQRMALEAGHGLVDGWLGHGIGRAMHEAPQVPCMVAPGLRELRDFTLLPGMVLAVEPLLVLGAAETPDAEGCIRGVATELLHDDWTVAVRDGRPAVHVEHTVAVTRHGPRVLTEPSDESRTQDSVLQGCPTGGRRR